MLTVTDRVPTYEGRVELIPVSGSMTLFDMARADQPTVVGTPINKSLFDSIAADLAMIAPAIESTASNIANSTNVACYNSLVAAGLLSDTTVTTDEFVVSVLPVHSAIFCSVQSDSITLSDLPTQTGTLVLMKGSSAAYVSGFFISVLGDTYRYIYSSTQSTVRGWSQMATTDYVDDVVGDISSALDTINGEEI